jgi:ribosomal protein L12E/L44/L45/RPP1/RPP2
MTYTNHSLVIAADQVSKLLKDVGVTVEKENLDSMMRSL